MLLVAIHHWLLNLLIGHQSDFRTFVHADTSSQQQLRAARHSYPGQEKYR